MLHLTNKELQELSDKWLSGTITQSEREKLEQWYNQESPEIIEWGTDDIDEDNLRERLFSGIKEVQKNESLTTKVFKISHTRKVAATLLFLSIFGLCYWLLPIKKNNLTASSNMPGK
ncbi:MAG TPA: hypothetical protein VGC01_01865, partial [Mucilaginibacter sp.]